MNKKILVTGGTGYIGSHTIVKLIENKFDVVILDNLSNSKVEVLNRIHKITAKKPEFIEGDILDRDLLKQIFTVNRFEAVIHFAGLKSVSESESEPDKYLRNNVSGSQTLIEEMLTANVYKLIFSSSATVYGDPGYAKCDESTPLNPISVYGQTKKFVEELIHDAAGKSEDFKYAILRYFNPVGAHESGLIGEDPNGFPNNLVPFISQVAVGKLPSLKIWGNDYPTPDGTGQRDYIHVEDLALGHIAALTALEAKNRSLTVNLGTGRPYSVLEVINSFERASGRKIPFEFAPRRIGDVAENFADPTLAAELLDWSAKYDLTKMCEDSWRWQLANPDGY
jgi:UDP-glucose 4-epimerase